MAEIKFTKIEAIIKEKNLLPRDAVYHTTRHVGSSGKIRVLVLKDGIARCEYICPSCTKYGYSEEPWKRPFAAKCANCGFKIAVPKMKEQFKREMKQARGA
ncbi:MAG: hypothetical protein QW548_02755 [Candidatus Aenigmatarchaeota archaeon]